MIFKVLISKSYLASIFFTIIQQLIVASSTVWIVKLGQAIVRGDDFSLWLFLFITSLLIVYIPSTLSVLFLKNAQFVAFEKYLAAFQDNYYGATRLRSSVETKNEKQPFLNNESWLVVNESLFFFSDWTSIVLNVAFNVIALGATVSSQFLYAYLATLPLVFFSLLVTSKWVKKTSSVAQKQRANMLQSVLPGWDSVLIGNKWNKDLWENNLKMSLNRARKGAIKTTGIVEGVTDISMILSLAPVLGVLLWIMYKNTGNTELLTVIIATLPRQITTIQHLGDVVLYAVQFNSLNARMQGLWGMLKMPSPANNYYGIIKWNDIIMSDSNETKSIRDISEIIQLIDNNTSRRITLRGGNGTGKTSILASLKEIYKDRAFFLPAHSDLVFESTYNKSFSTGQNILEILNEIKTSIDVPVLLLDEWDANLDKEKMVSISNSIDELAKTMKIVEVRHRTPAGEPEEFGSKT